MSNNLDLFVARNAEHKVIAYSVPLPGGQGAYYTLEDTQTHFLTPVEIRQLPPGFPKWLEPATLTAAA